MIARAEVEKNTKSAVCSMANKGKYWYHTTIYMCVLCGRENKYRERRPMPKPEEHWKRIEVIEDACHGHFF